MSNSEVTGLQRMPTQVSDKSDKQLSHQRQSYVANLIGTRTLAVNQQMRGTPLMGFANHRGSELEDWYDMQMDNNDNIVITNKTNSNNRMILISERVNESAKILPCGISPQFLVFLSTRRGPLVSQGRAFLQGSNIERGPGVFSFENEFRDLVVRLKKGKLGRCVQDQKHVQ